VAIIEDQTRTREGLRALIASSDGFECIGAWGSMEQALAADWRVQPNVVLLDLGLPGMSGIEGITVLRKRDGVRG
jgi:DNA-binding NarL/FixJ family response regulator